MALLAGIDVDHAFDVFDPKADDRLGMSLKYWDIYDKIALKNVAIELEFDAVTKIHFFERSLQGAYNIDAITFLQRIVPEAFKSMFRRVTVLGIVNHCSFADSYMVDPLFLEQDNHVFHHPRSSDNPPLGKGADLGPKNNVGLDKDFRAGGQVIQPAAEVNCLADGRQWGLVTYDGHF